MRRRQVPQAPEVTSLDKREQMEGSACVAVPIEVWYEDEAGVRLALHTGDMLRTAKHDGIGLGDAIEDVFHPLQSPALALARHVRSHVGAVHGRGLGHHPHRLCRILADVLLRCRPDQVDFDVGVVGDVPVLSPEGFGIAPAYPPQEPVINIVRAQRRDGVRSAQCRQYGSKGGWVVCEGSALNQQDGVGIVNGAEEGEAAIVLVWREGLAR